MNSRVGITPRAADGRANPQVNATPPTTPSAPPPPAPAGAPILSIGAWRVTAVLAAYAHSLRAVRLRRRAGEHGQPDDPAALAAGGRVAPAGGGRVDGERTPRAASVLRVQLRSERHGGRELPRGERAHPCGLRPAALRPDAPHPGAPRLARAVRRRRRRLGVYHRRGAGATFPANPGRDRPHATRGVAHGLFLSAHALYLRTGHRGGSPGGRPAAVARGGGRRLCPRHGHEGGEGHRAAARLPLRPHVCRRLVARGVAGARRVLRGAQGPLGVLAARVLSPGGNRGSTVGFGVGVPRSAYPLIQFKSVNRYF